MIYRTPDGEWMATRANWSELVVALQTGGQRDLSRRLERQLAAMPGDVLRLTLNREDSERVAAANNALKTE